MIPHSGLNVPFAAVVGIVAAIRHNLRTMPRVLVPLLAALLLIPASGAAAADPPSIQAEASGALPGLGGGSKGKPKKATVKVKVLGLRNGRTRIFSRVGIAGSLKPFAPGERVRLRFFLNGHKLRTRTVKVRKRGGAGAFRTKFFVRKPGRYAVQAVHRPSDRLRGDSTVRKQWKLRYFSADPGECGLRIEKFKQYLDRIGYASGDGSCFGPRTARVVLAYRKVNGMNRNFHAGKRLVKRVFLGKGRYRLRHPRAGEHAEVNLAKQVLVFARKGKPFAVYPVSTGAPATPTVQGHFEFQYRQPGYNSVGMYYSTYFYGGYAVHGYHSVPNYPASHGCVRAFIPDAKRIYRTIFLGEDIYVY